MNRSHRSGSPLTLCLILLLTFAFLSPLYHSHNHDEDHHLENSDAHDLRHDGAEHEDLSDNNPHNGSHLHIKKVIGRNDDHLRFTGRSLKADACAVSESFVITAQGSGMPEKYAQTSLFRSNAYNFTSGLSPPAV